VLERHHGSAPQDYATDVLGAQAVRFVQTAPVDRPWFLYFSPNAPHLPWVPSPTYAGEFRDVRPPFPSLHTMNEVAGKPAYVRALAPKTEADRQGYIEADRNERAMLRSVDDWFRAIVDAVAARGELDRTVIIFLTDNGYTFGMHRLDGKRFPYTPSIGVPFAIRTPWAPAGTVENLVSNLDLAGTIAALAGAQPGLPQAGISLVPAMQGQPLARRPGVFLDWGGDAVTPPWQGVVTPRFLYVHNDDGFEELYRASDALQLHNVAGDPPAGRLLSRGRTLLADLAAEAGE
jgi:N-acetylglucosamine-6-sulfatase